MSNRSMRFLVADRNRREQEVFASLAAGHTDQEIAHRFSLSSTTVKTHVARVLAKLDLRDRVQVVINAYEYGHVQA